MQVQIHAPWTVDAELDNVIWDKVEKLKTFFDRIERADIYLKTGDSQFPDAKIVEIRLAVPGYDLHAAGEAEKFEKAVAGATEKLRRQLIKHKAKLNKR